VGEEQEISSLETTRAQDREYNFVKKRDYRKYNNTNERIQRFYKNYSIEKTAAPAPKASPFYIEYLS
jgi:hypothetical protein